MELTNLDISGAGLDTNGRSPTLDDALDVMLAEAALHRDRLLDVDIAGGGLRVKVETLTAGQIQPYVAGACVEPPV